MKIKEHVGVPCGSAACLQFIFSGEGSQNAAKSCPSAAGRAFRSVAAAEKKRQATRLQSLTQKQVL